MTTGVVLSVDVERYGDTLTVATAATDVVLQVEDVVDFADEDDFAAGPQWLVIGDSAPMQYVSVDDDADTVTLAAAVGAVYEAGEPVRMWDDAASAEVIGYLCWVELDEADENDQPIPVEVRHERMAYFGVDNLAGLIGARVSLEPDEDDAEAWYVAEVIGRAPVIDAGAIQTPYHTGYLAADVSIPSGERTVLNSLLTRMSRGFPYPTSASGWLYLPPGAYLITVTANWAGNSSGVRRIWFERMGLDLLPIDMRVLRDAPSDGTAYAMQGFLQRRFTSPTQYRISVDQSSGAALTLRGHADGIYTAVEVVQVASVPEGSAS